MVVEIEPDPRYEPWKGHWWHMHMSALATVPPGGGSCTEDVDFSHRWKRIWRPKEISSAVSNIFELVLAFEVPLRALHTILSKPESQGHVLWRVTFFT
jgi:hypothetical protein